MEHIAIPSRRQEILTAMSWASARARFNHDWLKNSFLQTLGTLMNVARGSVQMEDGGVGLCSSMLEDWRERSHKAKELAETFEKEMSPAQLFLVPPLDSLNNAGWAALPTLIHTLWLIRYPVKRWVSDTLDAWQKGEDEAALIMKQLETGASLIQMGDALLRFQGTCTMLADTLSQFPSEIQIA